MAKQTQEQEWGIRYNCPKCNKIIKFPSCPNYETSREEQVAHMIYSECANMKRPCWNCELKKG